MIKIKCPNCGANGMEVVMFQGFYYTECCDFQLDPEFEEEEITERDNI
jgi:hypothetical protein